jgi:hypothetical protein
MTEERNKLAALFAACWKDEALKARFMSDPKAVMAEHGIDVPDGVDVNVVENTDTSVNITMPAGPTDAADLSDEELGNVAGGVSLGDPGHSCYRKGADAKSPCVD